MDVACPGFIPLSRSLGFPALEIWLGPFISLFFHGLFPFFPRFISLFSMIYLPFFPLQAGIPSLPPRRFFVCVYLSRTPRFRGKKKNPKSTEVERQRDQDPSF